MSPKRIQRQRTKGWRMPEGAIYVGRPSRWRNPFAIRTARDLWPGYVAYLRNPRAVGVVLLGRHGEGTGVHLRARDEAEARSLAVDLFRRRIGAFELHPDGPGDLGRYLAPLRGHDLVCWCPLDEPCHADVLLELANLA